MRTDGRSTGSWLQIAGILGLVVVLATGCAGGQSSTLAPTDAPSPLEALPSSPAPTRSVAVPALTPTRPPSPATPGPTIPAGLDRTAAVQRDGIEVVIELQRNPMPAGEPSWLKTTVTNRRRTDVTWLTDTCAQLVYVEGASSVAWSMGEAQPGNLGKFKTYALGGSVARAPSPFAAFWFDREVGRGDGSSGCLDVANLQTLAPGESREQRLWWSGSTLENRALPPAGLATLSVSTTDYWRDRDPDRTPGTTIRFEVPAWIEARDAATRLSPAEVVDRALADQGFARFVETQKVANGRSSVARYQPDTDRWEVGVLPWYETVPPRIHGVVVDAKTGAILGPLDRPWSIALEGTP